MHGPHEPLNHGSQLLTLSDIVLWVPIHFFTSRKFRLFLSFPELHKIPNF